MNTGEITQIGARIRLTRESGEVLTGTPDIIIRHINRHAIKINDTKALPMPYRNQIKPELIVKT